MEPVIDQSAQELLRRRLQSLGEPPQSDMGTAAVAPAPLPHANRNAGWQLPPPSGPPSGSAPTGPGNGAEVIDLTDGNGQQQYVMPAFLHDLRAHHQPYQQQLGLTPGHQTLPQSLPNQQQAMAEGFSQPRVFPGSYANLINPLPGSAAAPVLQPTAFIPQRDISSHVLDWRHIQQQQQSQQQQQQQQPLQQQHTGIGHVVSGQTSSLQAWLAQGLAQQAAHMQARSLAPTHTSAPIEAHPSLGAQIQAVAQRMLEAVQATGTSPDVQSIFEHARSWVLNRQQAAADALLQQLAGQARVQYPSGYPYQNRGVVSGQPYAPPARYTENGAGLGGVYGGTGGKVPLQFAAPPPGKAPAVSYAAASPSTNAAAALRAIIEGMEAVGPLGEGEMQPPEGMMTTPLLRHQRLALTWMSRRESGTSQPVGGILADDQGLGKTVTTIALIVCHPRHGQQRAVPPAVKAKEANAKASGSEPDAQAKEGAEAGIEILEEDGKENGNVAAVVKKAGGKAPASGADGGSAKGEQEVVEIDITEGDENAAVSKPAKQGDDSGGRMVEGGTLVVCPTTVLHQWEQEIKTKTNALAGIDVYVYHGKSKGVLPQALGRFAVVLTTYGTLSQELPEARKPQSKQTSGDAEGYIDLVDEDDGRPSKKAKKEKKSDKGGPLYRVSWHRVVLDEAQVIKNPRTMAAHAVWALRAGRRWCLSGTPLQNAVDDLYAYFRFLRYSPYNKYQAFKELIRDPIMGQNPDVGFRRLQAVLQIILLRRTKTSKIDGQPVITLPERKVTLVQKEFSQEEREFYVKLEKDAAARMKRLASEGAGQTYVNMLWMLLRMRQACNHPRLVRGDTKQSSRREKEAAAEAAAARKLPAALRTSLAATLRDGLTECAECGDVPEEPVVSVCGHIFCRQCVSTAVSSAGQDTAEAELAFHCPTCSRTLGKNDTFGEGALHVHSGGDQGASSYGADKDWASSTKLEALMGVLQNLRAEGEAAAAEDDQPMVRSLSQAQLGQALGRGRGSNGRLSAPPSNALYSEKVIVFSQWTSMLDLIEARLKKEKYSFRRLDGTMTVSARQTAVDDFNTQPEVTVMLVSLKAASLGLNLVSANHVVLMDLWYNPATEDQAIDRAHRIGQTKPVHVTRITIKDTVEDRILQLQEKKQKMVDSALGEDGAGGKGLGARLTLKDLNFLFGVSSD